MDDAWGGIAVVLEERERLLVVELETMSERFLKREGEI